MTKKSNEVSINTGFGEDQRETVARLFWSAFKGKLGLVMNPEAKAIQFFASVADPTHAISATRADGTLIGVAGFKTQSGSFIGGELKDLQTIYGWFGGLWRGLILSVLERPLADNTLLMDGIMVSDSARGQGVGTDLLSAVKRVAASLNCSQVRLDVIDINPRARALYERQGFVAKQTNGIGPLRFIFGFRTSTTMVCEL